MLRDTYLVAKHELLVTARNPFWIVFGLFQPIVYLLLFAPFLKGVASTPGFPGGDSIQFFAPGLLIMNAMFNAGFAGFGIIEKMRSGFLERLRVTPISRVALVLGLVLVSTTEVILQSVLLVLVSLFFGLTVTMAGIALLLVLLVLVAIAMASASFSLALIVKDEGILAGVTNFFQLPLLLLSGVLLPIAFAPALIRALSALDPFRYAADAARDLIVGGSDGASVTTAFPLFVILAAIALGWFVRMIREAVA